MKTALRRALLGLAVACAITACGSDSSTGPSTTIAGTWSLKSVNGTPLPFVLAQSGANKAELLSDVIVISGTGSFTRTTTVRTTLNGAVSTQSTADAGSYTLNGTALTLHFNSDGSTGTGSWSGDTITATDSGLALVYAR